MNWQREQSAAMQKVAELFVLTRDQKDETLVVRPVRSLDPTAQWTTYDDEKLRLALAKHIHRRPISWFLVANEIFWRAPAEVFKQIHKFLQDLQGELLSQVVDASANRPDETGSSQQLVQFQRGRENRNLDTVGPEVEEERGSAKRSVPQLWTEQEKERFEKGIETYGWGSWKLISENFLPTRTPNQLASHAQKVKKKEGIGSSTKKRKCDDESGYGTRSESPDPSS